MRPACISPGKASPESRRQPRVVRREIESSSLSVVRRLVVFLGAGADLTAVAVDHLSDLDRFGAVLLPLIEREQVEVSGFEQVALRFIRRLDGVVEKASEVLLRRGTAPLDDVVADAVGGPGELRSESHVPAAREAARQLVQRDRQRVRPLPELEMSEVLHAPLYGHDAQTPASFSRVFHRSLPAHLSLTSAVSKPRSRFWTRRTG